MGTPLQEQETKSRRSRWGRRLGKSQYDLLTALSSAKASGCTTAELKEETQLDLRTIQDSMRRLYSRGLVDKKILKHNKNRWYYSEIAGDFLTHWPALPPHAKISSR